MKINIIVHPNSKKPRVEKDLLNNTHIYVNEPPIENKANKEVIRVLSELYKVSKSNIKLITGSKSKHKIFEITSK